MRWLQTEYLLKGVFLGLVFYAAMQLAAIPAGAGEAQQYAKVVENFPSEAKLKEFGWECFWCINLSMLAGLGAALVLAAVLKIRSGLHARGRVLPFLLYLLLESPTLAYLGILGGAVFGILQVREAMLSWPIRGGPDDDPRLLLYTLGAGALAGLGFGQLRQVRQKLTRLGIIIGVGGALIYLGLRFVGLDLGEGGTGKALRVANAALFAYQLLLGIPFLYVLTFAGHEEETEVEFGAMCAGLGLSLAILLSEMDSPYWKSQSPYLFFVLPLLLYLFYTIKVLPGLRVFKHCVRGLSYARVGRTRKAILAFRRALQLDPNNALAREGFWEVHRSLDLDALARDKDLLAVVDFDLCLDRAGTLLIAGKPTAAQMQEANRLLEMVLSLRPDFRPAVDYWRAVAHTHLREYDVAARELEQIIDPAHYGPGNAHRQSVLLPAWQLALTLHEELRKRVGQPQLAIPGRRMDAIAAVERHLAANPGDANVEPLKRLLYSDITEAEYDAYAGEGGTAPLFDHAYAQHLGLALINDDTRWRRGGEYLRLAARGLPTLGPTIFMEIGKAHQRVGHQDEARHNFELAKRAGKSVGPKNLAEQERQSYFATVKWLGEEAMGRGDLDYAIENIHLCTESERSGLETLRLLAELYERRSKECESRGDHRAAGESVLRAVRANDMALVYNPRDKDLLERKDRYYYSVMPEVLKAHLEEVKGGFDFDYCLRKGRSILESRTLTGPEWLDVAYHMVQLVMVGKPEWLQAKVLLARSMLRFGEREKALALLETVRNPKPEKFASGEDEDAWYQSCQLLGDLYMELGRPDEAVPCYTDFRRSAKSGARTLYKLGEAYEQLGDRAKAAKCYEQVTAYEGNPLAGDAHEALHRVKGG